MTLCDLLALCWRGGNGTPAEVSGSGATPARPQNPDSGGPQLSACASVSKPGSRQAASVPVHQVSHAAKEQELHNAQTQAQEEQAAWVPRPPALLGEVWGAAGGGPAGAAGQAPTVVGLQLRALVREVVLGDFLGAGYSGGKVFRATWRGSTVALKLMVSSDLDQLRLTTREALLSRTLSHPHLVQTYALSISQLAAEDLAPETYAPPPRAAGPAGGRGFGGVSAGDSYGPGAGISTAANALLATSLLQTMSPMLAMAAEGSGRGGEAGGGRSDVIADLDELAVAEPLARVRRPSGAGAVASSGSKRRGSSGLSQHQLTPPQHPLLMATLRAGGGSCGGNGSGGPGFARVSVGSALTGIPEPLEGEDASGDCPPVAGSAVQQEADGGTTVSLVGMQHAEESALRVAAAPAGLAACSSRRSSSGQSHGDTYSRSQSSLTAASRRRQVLSAAMVHVASVSASASPALSANRRLSTPAFGAATTAIHVGATGGSGGGEDGAGAAVSAVVMVPGPGGGCADRSSSSRATGTRRRPSLGGSLASISSATTPVVAAEACAHSVPAAGNFPSAFSAAAAGAGRCSDRRGSGGSIPNAAPPQTTAMPMSAAVALIGRAGSGGIPQRYGGGGGRCASPSRLSLPSASASSNGGSRAIQMGAAAGGGSFRHRGSGNLRTVLERAASLRAVGGGDAGVSTGGDVAAAAAAATFDSALGAAAAASEGSSAPGVLSSTRQAAADLQGNRPPPSGRASEAGQQPVETPPAWGAARLRDAVCASVRKCAVAGPDASGAAELLTFVEDAELIAAAAAVSPSGAGASLGCGVCGGGGGAPAHQPLLHSTATLTTTDDDLFPLTLREMAQENPAAAAAPAGQDSASACAGARGEMVAVVAAASGSPCGSALADVTLGPSGPLRSVSSGGGGSGGGGGAVRHATATSRSQSSPNAEHVDGAGAGAGSGLLQSQQKPPPGPAVTSFTAEAALGGDRRRQQLALGSAMPPPGEPGAGPRVGASGAGGGSPKLLAGPGSDTRGSSPPAEPATGSLPASGGLVGCSATTSTSPHQSPPPARPPPPASAPALSSQLHPRVSGAGAGASAAASPGLGPGPGGLHVLHGQPPLVAPFFRRPSQPHGPLSRMGTQDSMLLNSHNNGWAPLGGLAAGGGGGHGTASQMFLDVDAAATPVGGGGLGGANSSMILFSEARMVFAPQLPPPPPPQADPEIVRFLAELGRLGAAPGRYLTAVIMELCDRGTLLAAINSEQAAKTARQQQQQQQQQAQARSSVSKAPDGSSAATAGAAGGATEPCVSSPFTQRSQPQTSVAVAAAEAEALVALRRGMLLPPPSTSSASVNSVNLFPVQQEQLQGHNSGGSATGTTDATTPTPPAHMRSNLSTASCVPSSGPGAGFAQSQQPRRQGTAGLGAGVSVEGLEQLQNALEVAQALAHLHSLDLVHGDLKPANVLLRASAPLSLGGGAWAGDLGFAFGPGTTATATASDAADGSGGSTALLPLPARGYIVKVADFGLTSPAASADGLPTSTKGSGWGALAYLAPEVVTTGGHGKPSDVYSYGALLWHMASGVPPHSQLHPAQILVGLAGGELQLEWPPDAEPTLRKIGAACLQRDPAARPSFEAIVAALLKAVKRTTVRLLRASAPNSTAAASGIGSGSGGGGTDCANLRRNAANGPPRPAQMPMPLLGGLAAQMRRQM